MSAPHVCEARSTCNFCKHCGAVAPDHLELFKEAGEWAKASNRTITPDMVELLGWLTGAASAWAEKLAIDKESLTVQPGATGKQSLQVSPLTRQQIDEIMTQHYPIESLLRESVDAFEACVRDIERAIGIV